MTCCNYVTLNTHIITQELIDASVYTECKISVKLFYSKDIIMKMVENMLSEIEEKESLIKSQQELQKKELGN